MEDQTVGIQVAFQEIHLWAADEACHRDIGWLVIDLRWGADLLNDSLMQHNDFLAEGQGLRLVMGHVDNRGVQPAVQSRQLHPHRRTKRSVEIRQRLVKEKNFGLSYNSAPQRHSLSLSSAQLLRTTFQQGVDFQQLRSISYLGFDFRRGGAAQPQRKGEIFKHRHVRIESIALKHERDITIPRREMIHRLAVDHNAARGWLLEPGDQPENRRFPATRRPQEYAKLAFGDFEGNVIQDLIRAKLLREPAYGKRSDRTSS